MIFFWDCIKIHVQQNKGVNIIMCGLFGFIHDWIL